MGAGSWNNGPAAASSVAETFLGALSSIWLSREALVRLWERLRSLLDSLDVGFEVIIADIFVS